MLDPYVGILFVGLLGRQLLCGRRRIYGLHTNQGPAQQLSLEAVTGGQHLLDDGSGTGSGFTLGQLMARVLKGLVRLGLKGDQT